MIAPPTLVRPDLSMAHAFNRFWRGTGFSPGELLLTPEMQRTLKLLSATPRKGVEYLRPHFLLNLVRKTANGYDYSLLEDAVDVMVGNGFVPFFEIMGNPSDAFDFQGADWAPAWRDLVSEMIQRLADRYGENELRRWYFESWNEPDLPWWPSDETAFLAYYDACVAGLDAAMPGLTVGGPGTARTLSPMFKAFVAHCDAGENRLTGERPRCDFISVHEKGVEKSFEDIAPDSVGICKREWQAIDYLRKHHPALADLPIINNECDPQVGWWQHHTWRATAYKPAIIAKIIDQHQRRLADEGAPMGMLFNDNGFIGEWGQRTQFTLFGGRSVSKAQSEHETDLERVDELRCADPFSLVKKPSLSVMDMLAQLGETRVPIPGLTPDEDGPGALATRDESGNWAVLLYNSRDAVRVSGSGTVSVRLPGTEGAWDVLVLTLDDIEANPFVVWEATSLPKPPVSPKLTAPIDVLDAMRRAAEPRQRLRRRFLGEISLDLEVPLPSVALVLAAPANDEAPPPPPAHLQEIDGLNGPEWLVSWEEGGAFGMRHDVALDNGSVSDPVPVLDAPILANAFVLSAIPNKRVMVRSIALSGATSEWVEAAQV